MSNTIDSSDAIRSEKYALVDFFATWCGPCKMLAPELEKAESKLTELGVKAFKADIDRCDGFAAEKGIQYVPTVILYKNGTEIDRFVGAKLSEDIIKFVSARL